MKLSYKEQKQLDFYTFLDHIKKRPGMYLIEPTLVSLQCFIYGYSIGSNKEYHNETNFNRFEDFGNWLSGYFEETSQNSMGWFGILKNRNEDSELEALNDFFTLLDIYKKDNQTLRKFEVISGPIEKKEIKRVNKIEFQSSNTIFVKLYKDDINYTSQIFFKPKEWIEKIENEFELIEIKN